jgi:hypothetical protein
LKMKKFLIDHVAVLPHYQRSIRFDADIGREDVLKSYVMTSSGLATLSELSKFLIDGNQAAFTWTGPYGTGKSALAVYLSALADRDSKIRKLSQQMLPGDTSGDLIRQVFSSQGKKWKVVPITGDRRNLFELINDGLKRAGFTKKGPVPSTADGLIQRVEEASTSEAFRGARPLIILDEMGKCLESALLGGGDIYDFQELAEGFARSRVRPIFIGILHQGFEYYASKMSVEIRQEWSKIQGRFVDLSLKTTTDEVVGLAARAVQADYKSEIAIQASHAVYRALRNQRPNLDEAVSDNLADCWPLHPVSVLLVSALSRKAFTQAQRSLFSFLSSNDPGGFREFLNHTSFSHEACYTPSHVFDYISINFDQALTSSTSEVKRWTIIKEGLSRVEARFGHSHSNVFKSIAVMELLKEPQSLLPTNEVLNILFEGYADVEQVTKDLAAVAVIVYRRYQNCWALYAGSDFDLEATLKEVRQGVVLSAHDFERAVDMAPVVAKSHYKLTGSLRWLVRGLLDVESARLRAFPTKLEGAMASLLIVVASSELELRDLTKFGTSEDKTPSGMIPVVLGIPESQQSQRHAVAVYQNLLDVVSLEQILRSNPQIDSDEIARKLLREQLEIARLQLHSHLESLASVAKWRALWNPNLVSRPGEKLSTFASRAASDLFPSSPRVSNELLNRESISTAAAKARKELMNTMLISEHSERLGLSGWPAEAGLYESIIRRTGHHVQKAGVWMFECSSERGDGFGALWRRTDELLQGPTAVSASAIYDFWAAPPIGLKAGLSPLFLWLYLLARKEQVVFYIDGVFQPQLAPINTDELLRKPSDFSVRFLKIGDEERALLETLASQFARINGELVPTDVLNVARAVVREFLTLPTWTKRTSLASLGTRRIRTEVLKASDPNQLIFIVLPQVVGSSDPKVIVDAILHALTELRSLLPKMVQRTWGELVQALGVTNGGYSELQQLKARAEEISDSASHPGLRTLLPRVRLIGTDGENELEQKFSLICTAAGKTERDFFDHDIERVSQVFREWALEFRKTELLRRLTHGSKHRVALTVGLGIPDSSSIVTTVDVDKRLIGRGRSLCPEIYELFGRLSSEEQAAALVELSKVLFKEVTNER